MTPSRGQPVFATRKQSEENTKRAGNRTETGTETIDAKAMCAAGPRTVFNATGTGADEIPAPELQTGVEETDLQCRGGLLTTIARRGAYNNRC